MKKCLMCNYPNHVNAASCFKCGNNRFTTIRPWYKVQWFANQCARDKEFKAFLAAIISITLIGLLIFLHLPKPSTYSPDSQVIDGPPGYIPTAHKVLQLGSGIYYWETSWRELGLEPQFSGTFIDYEFKSGRVKVLYSDGEYGSISLEALNREPPVYWIMGEYK